MTFSIVKFSLTDQAYILSERNRPTLSPFASTEARHSTGGRYWLVDSERNCRFLSLYSRDIRSEDSNYLLVLDNELVVAFVPEESPVTITIKYFSAKLNARRAEVIELLMEALAVGGRYCLGSEPHSRVDVAAISFEDAKG